MREKTLSQKADFLVNNHVLWNVDQLIRKLMTLEPDSQELTNLLYGPWDEETEDHQEVFTWVQINEPLAAWLKEEGETVEEVYGLYVWARCSCNQLISNDHVIEKIAEKLLI